MGESGNAGPGELRGVEGGVDRTDEVARAGNGHRADITVNAVAPGFIETDMTAGLNDEMKDRSNGSSAGRFGKPEDVAAAVRFLCSEEAGYITGHVLDVNGGMYMRVRAAREKIGFGGSAK